jgi:hypothetical protein
MLNPRAVTGKFLSGTPVLTWVISCRIFAVQADHPTIRRVFLLSHNDS